MKMGKQGKKVIWSLMVASVVAGSMPVYAETTVAAAKYAKAIGDEQASTLRITEILYDAEGSDDGTEFVEISNLGEETLDISGYLIGDEETRGGNEGMFAFPEGTLLPPGASIVIAQSAMINKSKYGYTPDYEFPPVSRYNPEDDPETPNLLPADWATGTLILANGGDDLLLMDRDENVIDYVPYINDTQWNGQTVKAATSVKVIGQSLQREYVTGDPSADFVPGTPSPGSMRISDREPEAPEDPNSKSLLITEVVNDPLFDESTGEFIEITNISEKTIDLSGYLIGDEETRGGNEGMNEFPEGTKIEPYQTIVIARYADGIVERHQTTPDFELFDSMEEVPELLPSDWATGSIYLANGGDHVILMDPDKNVVDAMTYGSATFPEVTAHPGVAGGHAMERLTATDTNDASVDFVDQPKPSPGMLLFGPEAHEDRVPVSDLKEKVLVVNEPETGIVLPPTVIGVYDKKSDLEDMLDEEVSSVFVSLKKSGRDSVVTQDGTKLEDVLEKLEGKAIPVVQIEDKDLVAKVDRLLRERDLTDVHIVSSRPHILKEMREKNNEYRGALLVQEGKLNEKKRKEIVLEARSSKSHVVVLQQSALSKDVIRYFRHRGLTVWGMDRKNKSQAEEMIPQGVAGILSDSPEQVHKVLATYPENSITQPPMVMAHRGVPSLKPENTMYAFEEAVRLGADLIETDVHMTKDGHLVIIHDFDLERTTDGTGKVKDYTLKELRELNANKLDPKNPSWYQPDITDAVIPTLDELLAFAKGKAVLLLEAKGIGYEKEMAEVIQEHDMVADVIVSSFSSEVLERFAKINPELGLGFTLSGTKPEEKLDQYAEKVVTDAVQLNATYFINQEIVTPELVRYAKHRGIILSVYTVNEEADMKRVTEWGIGGIITDYAQKLLDAPKQ
ncbi:MULTISPECIES: glycerophosphodiester phosphodiesterase family protein [Brevibacillus]|uniref:Glycerophosphodiester phosphodiesterase n=1 Tax=Brevibacillus invocatus TaxID=173959 RepID=A0A3M8CFL4_9BACL|nr:MULTISPECIES: glycerophosphodiester phosphodiesterase family protein [Brevibacillus]MDH4616327.1 lamin tail domain-containing protein [Brevibacillus sp. AY1]RNB74526.1 glycerophosphodiester phosphodiesterase [Brevibacillus invocatus]